MTPLPPSDGMALTPVVTVGGSRLAQKWADALVELRVELAVRTIGRCTLRFADPGYTLIGSNSFTVGTPVTVSARAVPARSRLEEVFRGVVTNVGVAYREGHPPELVAVVEDAAFDLARNSRAQTYLKSSYSEVVTAVLKNAGVRCEVSPSKGVQEYVLQTDTDLGFIDEIARRLGWDWVVDRGTFRFWPSWTSSGRTGTHGPDVTVHADHDLQDFTVSVTADAPSTVTVRGWDPLNQKAVEGSAKLSRSAVPDGLATAAKVTAAKSAQQVTAAAGPADKAEADTIATAHVRSAGVVLAKGRCTITPALRPGVLVDVHGVGPASGKYFVQEVVHTYRSTGFHTQFVAGDKEPTRLTEGPERGAASFAHAGLVIGTVTDVNDPDRLGRVRVNYTALSEQVESTWARVVTVGGGNQRGAVFLPETGDEVLVGFEDADSRRPVVLGGLYGKTARIPEWPVADGRVKHRRLTSRLGHVIELGDGSGAAEQHVLLALAGQKHRLRLGKDKAAVEVPTGVPLRLAAGDSSIELDGKGGITIDATKITIKAKQAVDVSGLEVGLKASTKLSASGLQAELKGSTTVAVEGGASTTIKGGMVQIN